MNGNPLRVLLVDDERSLRDPLGKSLRQQYGYAVDTAATGKEALACVKQAQGQYDVILLDDLLMPDRDQEPERLGIKLMKEIRAQYPDSVFILFTAWGRESGLEALRAGAYRYLLKPFHPEELAAMIELAAEYQHLKGIAREKQMLERLMETSATLLGDRSQEDVLHTILCGVQAIGFDRARLYLRDEEDENAMVGRAQVGMEADFKDIRLSIAYDPYVQRLLADPRPRVFERSEDHPLPYEMELAKETVDSWACAPLMLGGEVIGKLSADNKYSGRPIEQAQLQAVGLFASQAAAAIENARLIDKEHKATREAEQRARNLKAIQEVLTSCTSLLDEEKSLDETCRAAVELLGAEHSGLVRFEEGHERGYVVAEFPNLGTRGQEIPVRGIPTEEALISTGEPLVLSDVASSTSLGHVREVLKRFDIQSILFVPVVFRGRVLASFSLDAIGHPREFTPAEVELCKTFADQVAVALENMRLFTEVKRQADSLAEQKDHFSRVVASSPTGVISIDRGGNVTGFNQQAQEILGYRPEEVLGRPVNSLYDNPQEHRKIGRELHRAPDGKVQGYGTDVRSKAGEQIPIRLAATWLYDAHGKRVGSVGYFEDLRLIDEKENRIEFLLKASNIVARAECLTEGLDSLAEMLVTHIATTFCRILILDEQQQNLIVEAAYPHPRATGALSWQPGHGESVALDDWPGLAALILEGDPTLISTEEEGDRPLLRKLSRYLGLEKPLQSLLLIPLRSQSRIIGLLSLGELRAGERQSFTKAKVNLAVAIAEQSAVLIDRMRLLEATERSKTRLTSLYEASNQLVSSQDPEQVLTAILDRVRSTSEASWVSALLIDESRRVRRVITSGTELQFESERVIRPGGISTQVMSTGQYVAIENRDETPDRVNPSMFRDGIMAALCLPLSLRGRQIGVVWVHYDKPRRFPAPDVEALQLYVNQAAVAYDSARRIAELEVMRQAADALAEATSTEDVLQQVVHWAKETLHADSTAFWSYEQGRDRFLLRESVAHGIPDNMWDAFRKEEPREGGTAFTVMKKGWIGVTDIADTRAYPFLGKTTRGFLQQINSRSFQGCVLALGEEVLGVLYANYSCRRGFDGDERRAMQTYANHVTLALKQAKVLDQVSKARNIARVVSNVTLLGDWQRSLESVAKGTKDVLNCDAVTVYAYDQAKNRFNYPPIMLGVWYPEKASRLPAMPGGSVVSIMLNQDEMCVVENAQAHPLFKGRRFTVEEKIVSLVTIPLKVGEGKVGVMFVNYRSPHRFTSDDLTNIDLFANQAAVAIQNARQYDELRRRSEHQRAVYAGSKVISEGITLGQRKLLDRILGQAVERIRPSKGDKAILGVIQLYDEANHELYFESAYPPEVLPTLMRKFGDRRSLVDNKERIGITGRTVLTCQPQRVPDVRANPDYLVFHPDTRSELNVPLLEGNSVLGVLSLESDQLDAFDKQAEEALENFAELAVIAIQNARQYDELERTKGLVVARTCIAWMGMVNSAWVHENSTKATTIIEEIDALRSDLSAIGLGDKSKRRLDKISRLAEQIRTEPIVPPLSSDEGVESVSAASLLHERLTQLWHNKPYASVQLEREIDLANDATVRTCPQWLRKAFDIIVDNAVQAVKGQPAGRITVTTQRANGRLEIRFSDTGPGIPWAVRENLFKNQIRHRKGESGLGVGLLMAQMIVQTYSGDIRVEMTGSTGTTILVQLPIEDDEVPARWGSMPVSC